PPSIRNRSSTANCGSDRPRCLVMSRSRSLIRSSDNFRFDASCASANHAERLHGDQSIALSNTAGESAADRSADFDNASDASRSLLAVADAPALSAASASLIGVYDCGSITSPANVACSLSFPETKSHLEWNDPTNPTHAVAAPSVMPAAFTAVAGIPHDLAI